MERLGFPVSRLDLAIERAITAFACRPSGLISDIDGTLSRIAPRPEDAFVSTQVRQSLEALRSSLDLLAVITGRDQATARQMVGIESLTYIGNYALDDATVALLDDGATVVVREQLRPMMLTLPCVQLEEKGVSFALHYRNCDEPDVMRARLLELVGPVALAGGTRVLEGKRVVEVVPMALPTKGTAIARLIDEHGLRGVVYLGDDIADVSVFRELRRRNEGEASQAVTIAVVDEETDPAVRSTADLALEGVDEVEAFLEGLCEVWRRRAWS